jgi:hypothetical protein
MYGATPKLQAKNLELCSDKKIKLSFYFRPQNLFTCVGERKRERERDVELFNFEKWTLSSRLFPSIFVSFFVFFYLFFIQRKSVAVIEKLLEAVQFKKAKREHSQKVNSFSTFSKLIQFRDFLERKSHLS